MRILSMPWEYEPDPARKHKRGWTHDFHGFVEVGNAVIGKCPHNLSSQSCEELLNNGIEYSSKRWPKTYPERIYNTKGSVVYRATPTTPGKSYHGFPEMKDRVSDLPRELKNRLLELAEQKGCRAEVEKWLKG